MPSNSKLLYANNFPIRGQLAWDGKSSLPSKKAVGLHLSSEGELIAGALVDDSFMFLQASSDNLEKGKGKHEQNKFGFWITY